MRGAATKSMSDIVEERQSADTRPSPPRPSGLRPAGLRGAVPAGFVARSSHTAWVLLVARASPAGLGASSKVSILFLYRPLAHDFVNTVTYSAPAGRPTYFGKYVAVFYEIMYLAVRALSWKI